MASKRKDNKGRILEKGESQKSELTGLTWKDVDFKNKTIDINHQLQYRYINGEIKKNITRLKTNYWQTNEEY